MISVARAKRQRAGRARQLAIKLFDDRIEDAECSELRGLLIKDVDARRAYLEAVFLQSDLVWMGKQLYRERVHENH
jgi:hypothetical protein